jgi:putative YphP/YqiW family bacilliredoxin
MSMYPPELIQPFRDELTRIGAKELMTPAEVDAWIDEKGTGLLVINSVCGCAAGAARPAVAMAMRHGKKPARFATVFAGQDKEATSRARERFVGIPPSSPSMALVKDGKVVGFVHRHQIERRSPEEIANDLVGLFEQHA